MSREQMYCQNFNPEWETNFFFSQIGNRTICLICGLEPKLVKESQIKLHFLCHHSQQYASYEDSEKLSLIEGLKLVYKECRTYIPEVTSLSEKAHNASYAISLLIAKEGKPFTEGDFIKKCLIEAVKLFGNSLTLEEAASIPLSGKTVRSRILDIGASIEDRLTALLDTCRYFSLCLTENTDNQHTNQLSIFARIVQNDFSYVEELLDFAVLHDVGTEVDIFDAVENTLIKFQTNFSKCTAVVTDGAKAMKGLCVQFKSRDLKFPIIHYIIHQEALCGTDKKLSFAMRKVNKIINAIRGENKFLSHKKFIELLETRNAAYTDVPVHDEVHWFSAANCLNKFFAIRKEIIFFLQEYPILNLEEYSCFITDVSFLCELSVIVDLTTHLNTLSLKLQKPGQSISELCSLVDSFRRRLVLFQNHLSPEQGSFFCFPTCKLIFEEFGTECDFDNHLHILRSFIDHFDKRFIDFDSLRNDLILFDNPLTARIEEHNLECREELCDLQNDISLKTREERGAEFFKTLEESTYPVLRNFAIRIFSMFGSTYLCESLSTEMRNIKTDQRTLLKDSSLLSAIRTSTSSLPIDISDLPSTTKRARKSSLLI
ncbi:general transcription factor II-I repeat domain-containing protein 2B-like [Halictus rubicundus]|uniref:general transcription factor II-I repeat domain-containing protein 2B-like n=1 Tax=Halictus rubicundus TaxID=77578 RepID=UPI00403508D1